MPYALFSNDAKLSKAYPTEADVWKHARQSGLVVDVMSEEEKPSPRAGAGQRLRDQALPAGPAGRSRQEPGRGRARSQAGNSSGFVKGAYVLSHRHSGARAPNSGLPEFGKSHCSKPATADLDANPESRDSQMCNCTSEVWSPPGSGCCRPG